MSAGSTVALLERSECDDLLIARFERPKSYSYHAGQWFRLTLETAEGPQIRTFSHASAPSDAYIELATRQSGSHFKQALFSMRPGDTALLVGPGGRLKLPEPHARTVFLVGGVGITPVRSLLRDAMQRQIEFDDAVVFYGNRGSACVAYLGELEEMASHGLRTVLVYESGPAGWGGAVGFISEELIRGTVGELEDRPFVVAGPPVMVTVMRELLGRLGVEDARTTIESFGRPS